VRGPKEDTDKRLKEEADKIFFQATFHFHHGELDEAHKLCSKAIGGASTSHTRATVCSPGLTASITVSLGPLKLSAWHTSKILKPFVV
jgi:hypothetical protein